MRKITVILCSLSLLLTAQLNAQAWSKAKGEGFIKIDVTSIRAQNVFDNFGTVVKFRTLGNYSTALYGEYGIGKKVTVVAYAPVFVRNTLAALQGAQTGNILQTGAVRNSVGDMDFGLRYPLLTGKFAASLNLMVGLPTGNFSDENALFTGDGEFNQMAKLSVGTSGSRWWTQGGMGFNNRTKGNSDEIRYDFEVGGKFLNDRLLAIFKVGGIESVNNGTFGEASTGLFSNNVEYFSLAPELLYFVDKSKRFGVSARAAGALKGRNVLAAPSYSLGIFTQF